MKPIVRLSTLSVAGMFVAMTSVAAEQPGASEKIPGADVFEAREFTREGKTLRYRFLPPADYDKSQQYPLVLFLHGAGERGDDNQRQLIHGGRNFSDPQLRKRHPAFIIAPQCPNDKKWVEVPWDDKKHGMPPQPSESLQLAFDLIDSLQEEYSIEEGRVYALGLSMGGFGVWDVLQRRPELLAAAVPICGGGDPTYAERFKHTPVWAFHGGDDPVVPVERTRTMVEALAKAGGRPVYTEYEGVGHDSWTATFDNRLVWDWLFAQRKK